MSEHLAKAKGALQEAVRFTPEGEDVGHWHQADKLRLAELLVSIAGAQAQIAQAEQLTRIADALDPARVLLPVGSEPS